MSSNIALFGMMGVGKSTVGRFLATRLGRGFADTDVEIARWRGLPIPDIFRLEGEPTFRGYESQVVRDLATYHDLVISLGGGTVLSDANVADLSLTSVLVLLDAPTEVLVERLTVEAEAGGRPLLEGDVAERVATVHAQRAERYRAVADHVVDAAQPADMVVEQILEFLREQRDHLTPSEFEAVMT